MRNILILLVIAVTLAGCKNSSNSSNVKRYPFKGKVIAVDRTAKKATIDHEAIEGYMSAMTMEFPVHADWVWNDLVAGSEIRAELVVDNTSKEGYWLENVGILAAPVPGQQPPETENSAQIGKPVPDFRLTNQDGKQISTKDFKGKALALTFIYARCPLPDYCIRMSTNFSDVANQLKDNAEMRDKIRLLSISFDPDNDTPAKLRSYGIGYLGNDPKARFDIWQLAVGSDAEVRKIADFFGLRYEVDQNDKTIINHSLRTAVIGPDGKVTKVFAGNEWTPAGLYKELQDALKADQK